MSEQKPFLQKFTKDAPTNEAGPNSDKAALRNGTLITRVARETTDDR